VDDDKLNNGVDVSERCELFFGFGFGGQGISGQRRRFGARFSASWLVWFLSWWASLSIFWTEEEGGSWVSVCIRRVRGGMDAPTD
jgi:hypothetical protein